MKIIGRWQDTFKYTDGRMVVRPEQYVEWEFNQIQNSFLSLLAAWCRAESGYARIGFMGIGSGLVGWDTTPPSKPYSQSQLTTEYYRLTIPQGDIVFIDPSTNVPTGGTPSSKIEVTVSIGTGDANGTMREFGLFGGQATSSLDSGSMVNWVIHDRIDKDASFELQRKVRIEFVEQS
jgi:hypothetical protein